MTSPAVSGSGNADSPLHTPVNADPKKPDEDDGSSRIDEIPSAKKVDYREYTFELEHAGTKLTATPKAGKGW